MAQGREAPRMAVAPSGQDSDAGCTKADWGSVKRHGYSQLDVDRERRRRICGLQLQSSTDIASSRYLLHTEFLPFRLPPLLLLSLLLLLLHCSQRPSQASASSYSDSSRHLPNPFDFSFPSHMCGSLRETYLALNAQVRSACRVEYEERQRLHGRMSSRRLHIHAGVRGGGGKDNSSEESSDYATPSSSSYLAMPSASRLSAGDGDGRGGTNFTDLLPPLRLPSASACRVLSFDSGFGGFGDTLVGLASSFAVALLSRRAFVMRQEWLQDAFEPAHFDWRASSDIQLDPAIRVNNVDNVPPLPEGVRAARHSLNCKWVSPEAHFRKLNHLPHLALSWNRGILIHTLTKATGEWADSFRALGVKPPYAFGCIIRLLLRPKPAVWQLARSRAASLHHPATFKVGVHIRVNDSDVWGGESGEPKPLDRRQVAELMASKRELIGCAESLERWWRPSSMQVKWFVIANSVSLKQALKQRFPNKVITTDFTPMHVALSKDPNSTETSLARIEGIQQTVAEWILLSSADMFVIPNSGFSKTAALYSMKPMRMFMEHGDVKCSPELPITVSELSNLGCRL